MLGGGGGGGSPLPIPTQAFEMLPAMSGMAGFNPPGGGTLAGGGVAKVEGGDASMFGNLNAVHLGSAGELPQLKKDGKWMDWVLELGVYYRNGVILSHALSKEDATDLKKAARRRKHKLAQQKYEQTKREGRAAAQSNLAGRTRSSSADEKLFSCQWEGCGYSASQASNLKRHARTHMSDEKPLICQWKGCGYCATTAGNLKQHTRTHTGKKLFACQWAGCGYSASRASDLKKHTWTHTGEKPFACKWEGCKYSAAQAGNLKVHARTHTGGKPAHVPAQGR